MNKESVLGTVTIVLGVILYIVAVSPMLHDYFNPVGFWQKLVMLLAIDVTSFVATLVSTGSIVNTVAKVFN